MHLYANYRYDRTKMLREKPRRKLVFLPYYSLCETNHIHIIYLYLDFEDARLKSSDIYRYRKLWIRYTNFILFLRPFSLPIRCAVFTFRISTSLIDVTILPKRLHGETIVLDDLCYREHVLRSEMGIIRGV